MLWSGCGADVTLTNLYAGPGKLPKSVLERLQRELTNYRGLGLSVMEINHRAPAVVDLIERTSNKIKSLLNLDENDEVLLLQGGGTLQFIMAPLNLSATGDRLDFVDTGYWTSKAIQNAIDLGRDVSVVAHSHVSIPKHFQCREEAKYLHICTNNTVMGTQWHTLPDAPVPIIADASSDFMSRPFDYRSYGLCYAHAQKTIGAAGVTVVVIRKDVVERLQEVTPDFLSYRAHIEAKSNFHTPPVFAIHVLECMLDWLVEEVGGLQEMGRLNKIKSDMLYDFLDRSACFFSPIQHEDRSQMNVVFELHDASRQEHFLAAAEQAGILGLAGHRARGGLRASLYNAVTHDDVERLVNFMMDYEAFS